VEGFVSIMAIVAASILIPGDYFAINSMLSPEKLTALGFPPQRIAELSAMVGTNVAQRPGGAVSLAVGMASIFSALPGMKGLMAYWYNFALMFEALFILTTVDTGTRVARFLVQELGGIVYKPMREYHWLPGTIIGSFIVVGSWAALIYTGSISTIWPMFGVSNQLLAGLALAIGTTIIIKMGKVHYAPMTAVPMAFMFVVTFTAAVQLMQRFWADAALKPENALVLKIDALLVGFMACLAIVIVVDAFYTWYKILSARALPVAETFAVAAEEE
jgi:carbon starvation protein